MPSLRPFLIVFGVAGALAAICLALPHLSEPGRLTLSYENLDDAHEGIEKHWIPYNLPASAHDIHGTVDMDTVTGKGSFRFDPRDFAAFFHKFSHTPDPAAIAGLPEHSLLARGFTVSETGSFDTAWTVALDHTGQGYYFLNYIY